VGSFRHPGIAGGRFELEGGQAAPFRADEVDLGAGVGAPEVAGGPRIPAKPARPCISGALAREWALDAFPLLRSPEGETGCPGGAREVGATPQRPHPQRGLLPPLRGGGMESGRSPGSGSCVSLRHRLISQASPGPLQLRSHSRNRRRKDPESRTGNPGCCAGEIDSHVKGQRPGLLIAMGCLFAAGLRDRSGLQPSPATGHRSPGRCPGLALSGPLALVTAERRVACMAGGATLLAPALGRPAQAPNPSLPRRRLRFPNEAGPPGRKSRNATEFGIHLAWSEAPTR